MKHGSRAYEYDLHDNIISVTDGLGNTQYNYYDRAGNPVKIKDANGAVTQFAYDRAGNLRTMTDAEGFETVYAYNLSGKPVSKTEKNGDLSTYEYDDKGRVSLVSYYKSTDAADAAGKAQPEERIRYTYDTAGRIISKSGSHDTIKYEYDARGQVISKKQEIKTGNVISETRLYYDAAGNISELVVNGNEYDVLYSYDALNRLTSVYEKNTGLEESYLYLPDGRMATKLDETGLITCCVYDYMDNVVSRRTEDIRGNLVYAEYNTYDTKGNLIKQEQSGIIESAVHTYEFDALDRLIKECTAGTDMENSISYAYDVMGNRISKVTGTTSPDTSADRTVTVTDKTTYSYDRLNRLVNETSEYAVTTYQYDDKGSLVKKTVSPVKTAVRAGASTASGKAEVSATTTEYKYSAQGLLTRVLEEGKLIQENVYDAEGIRAAKNETGKTSDTYEGYVTFSGQTLATYDKNGNTTKGYVYGTELVAQITGLTTDDGTTSKTGCTTGYYSVNHMVLSSHGDVRGVLNTAGEVLNKYSYDAFGNLVSSTETVVNTMLYTSEQYDAQTGLYYLRARMYNSGIGRFISEDTYLGDGRNLYVYVANNPLKYIDPSGHASCKSDDGFLQHQD